jgi:hypothetical protein
MAQVQPRRTSIYLLRGELSVRWEQLTEADLEQCISDRTRLIEVLQTRYGFARRRAEKEVDLFYGDFYNRLRLAA